MAAPMRFNAHHISSTQHQQSHPAAPHLAELANNNHNKRRNPQTPHGVSGYHRNGNQLASNVSASAAVAQSHLARVNASVAASPQRKASDSAILNGAINGNRPEVVNFFNFF